MNPILLFLLGQMRHPLERLIRDGALPRLWGGYCPALDLEQPNIRIDLKPEELEWLSEMSRRSNYPALMFGLCCVVGMKSLRSMISIAAHGPCWGRINPEGIQFKEMADTAMDRITAHESELLRYGLIGHVKNVAKWLIRPKAGGGPADLLEEMEWGKYAMCGFITMELLRGYLEAGDVKTGQAQATLCGRLLEDLSCIDGEVMRSRWLGWIGNRPGPSMQNLTDMMLSVSSYVGDYTGLRPVNEDAIEELVVETAHEWTTEPLWSAIVSTYSRPSAESLTPSNLMCAPLFLRGALEASEAFRTHVQWHELDHGIGYADADWGLRVGDWSSDKHWDGQAFAQISTETPAMWAMYQCWSERHPDGIGWTESGWSPHDEGHTTLPRVYHVVGYLFSGRRSGMMRMLENLPERRLEGERRQNEALNQIVVTTPEEARSYVDLSPEPFFRMAWTMKRPEKQPQVHCDAIIMP